MDGTAPPTLAEREIGSPGAQTWYLSQVAPAAAGTMDGSTPPNLRRRAKSDRRACDARARGYLRQTTRGRHDGRYRPADPGGARNRIAGRADVVSVAGGPCRGRHDGRYRASGPILRAGWLEPPEPGEAGKADRGADGQRRAEFDGTPNLARERSSAGPTYLAMAPVIVGYACPSAL